MSKRVEENEPKAQARGYKSDAANVDDACANRALGASRDPYPT